MASERRRGRVSVEGDIFQLALSSIDNISDIARTIMNNDKAASKFCKNLRVALARVKTKLEKQNESQSEAQQKKVKSLLRNLERLCNWPRSTQQEGSSQWPTLTTLQNESTRNQTSRRLRIISSDDRQGSYRADVIEKLSNYSKATWKEAANVAEDNDTSVTPRVPNRSLQLDDDIECLYRILKQYRLCGGKESPGEIVTNIRLNGYRTLSAGGASVEYLVKNASAEFGVLFLDHPHAYEGCWQETSIQICHTVSPEVPTIQVTSEEPALESVDLTAAITEHVCIPLEDFCNYISNRDQDLLRLFSRDNKLVHRKRTDLSREWLAHREAIPLARLFAKPDLCLFDKSKAILSMLAAKATWQFYESDLIGQGLTSDNVQFICEKRFGITGVFINEPMLRTQYTKNGNPRANAGGLESQILPTKEMIHDMPKILALGILLLELETRKTMKKHRENPRLCPPGPFGINTDYNIAYKLVAAESHLESIISHIDPLSPLRKILPLCIKPGSIASKAQERLIAEGLARSPSIVNNQNALRSVIYSEIVHPLEEWVKRYDNFENIQPLYEVSDSPPELIPRRSPAPHQYAPPPRPADLAEMKLREDSRKWFEHYYELRDVLQSKPEERKSGYRAVKIAVLDTGMSKDLYDYYKDCCPDDLEYEDFIDRERQDKSIACDDIGHGSAAISIIERMSSNVIYCVGRVLRKKNATCADVNAVVQGIDWAIEKGVDIITMAIGFKEEQGPVVQAVERAHKSGILIFSAASNERNLDGVYCPANLTDQVFGIFSTNAGIRESQSLNPGPLAESFAVFGEGVELEQDLPLLRGTSYSTSVAAGLAALLLDFSRQEKEKDKEDVLSKLKNRLHMKGVLREMAKRDNGYLCLQPWSLLKSKAGLEKMTKEDARKGQREWIRGTIERLLQPNNLHRA